MTQMFARYLLVLYIAWRVAWANRMPLMDCDEVYNYWEPLHHLHYGSGMQTWEYSPEFALRTYAYLLPMQALSHLYDAFIQFLSSHDSSWIQALSVSLSLSTSDNPKILVFGMLRATLAATSALVEWQFCSTLADTTVSLPVAIATLIMLGTSTGMMHASAAYLPSSTTMILWMVCARAYLTSRVRLYVACAVLATLAVGWPFGVILFVPMGLHILYLCRRNLGQLAAAILFTTLVVQAIVMGVDYVYYERQSWVSPILNIFLYNAQGGGDELYGIEPASYYVKNLLLNFNYVAVLGIMSWPVALLCRMLGHSYPNHLLLCLAPMYLWLAIVLPRPHKEERFLFPIYPSLVFGAVVTSHALWQILCGWTSGDKTDQQSTRSNVFVRYGWLLLLLPSSGISILRSMALSKYYTAPVAIYGSLPSPVSTDESNLVCTCGEWYRFPSSYLIPEGSQLAFLPSSFQGQLPKPFGKEGSFNDKNQEELDRYVDYEDCDYVVALMESGDECAPRDPGWSIVAERAFLDASRTTALHRILYLPYLHEEAVVQGAANYVSYTLFRKNAASETPEASDQTKD